MKETAYILIIFVETLALMFLSAFSFFIFLEIPLKTVPLYENCQENIFWEDANSPYCLKVYMTSTLTKTTYSLSVTKKDLPDYGFAIPHPYIHMDDEPNVVWKTNGVEYTIPKGPSFFIPKEIVPATR